MKRLVWRYLLIGIGTRMPNTFGKKNIKCMISCKKINQGYNGFCTKYEGYRKAGTENRAGLEL